ncbi:MAG: PD-(D/E)XK nuclease family protein [Chloroflexota bacterium]
MPDFQSPTQLQLAPAGAGKTEYALKRLVEASIRHPFGKKWVLLPTERQAHAFRRRLLDMDPSRHTFFNVEFLTFYSLYSRLLDAAGRPHRCLDEAARFRLVRLVAQALAREGELNVFAGIATTPGFVRVVADFIYELKQNLIEPETFLAQAQTVKDHDLGLLYARYQALLGARDLVDREGMGWLALDTLRNMPALATDVDLFLVDGFDQFSVVQARITALLGGRARESVITLTTVPGQEQVIGRRFQRALERLEAMHALEGQPLEVEELDVAAQDRRHPALRHLVDSLFRSPVAVRRSSDGALKLIEAPEPAEEIAAIFRHVKRLLLEGVHPNEIVIAVRDWATYAPHIHSLAHTYGLAHVLAVQHGEPLRDNPAIAALFDLLDLHAIDFRRRELLDVLRSPYIELPGLDGEWIQALDRVSRRLVVTGGRVAWRNAIRAAASVPLDPEDEDGERLLSAHAAEHLEHHLLRFFDRVTPPESASARAYVRWLELLIGDDPENNPDEPEPIVAPDVPSVNMIGRLRTPARPGIVERDLTAFARFKDVLRAFVTSQTLFSGLDGEETLRWDEFIAELKAAVAATTVDPPRSREGRVLLTYTTDARGLPHRHVIIVGLSEGLFPARVPEDPLYLDSERRRLSEAGIPLLTAAERVDDDGLFYELVSLAQETLTLSRPTIKNGAPWPESHLWRGVMRLFGDAIELIERDRVALGAVTPPDQAASASEAALAVADGLNASRADAATVALYNWLLAEWPAFWERIAAGRAIEKRRLSAHAPHDRYSGRLSDPAMIDAAAAALGPGKLWSASQLNDYGICAFRYFAGRMLQLEAQQEPDDGMTFMHIGSMNHEILEHTYKQIGALGLSIRPENAEIALSILRDVAREVLREAPKRLGFQPSALWEQEKQVLMRKLDAFVRHDFSDPDPLRRFGSGERTVYAVEVAFGEDGRDFITLDLGDAGPIRVRGRIDRIDRIGDSLVVIDYKTGATPIDKKELLSGRNFQMMLYVLAAERLLARDPGGPSWVAGGVFWHIGSRSFIGTLERDDAGLEAMSAAREHLARYLLAARGGDFTTEANRLEDRKCARYCEFSTLCRVAIMARNKPRD